MSGLLESPNSNIHPYFVMLWARVDTRLGLEAIHMHEARLPDRRLCLQ